MDKLVDYDAQIRFEIMNKTAPFNGYKNFKRERQWKSTKTLLVKDYNERYKNLDNLLIIDVNFYCYKFNNIEFTEKMVSEVLHYFQ